MDTFLETFTNSVSDMKRIAFVLVMALLLLQACSPEPVYRLKSKAGDKYVTYHKGVEYITLQNDSVQVTISYYQHNAGLFSMDVQVDNNSNRIIRVDPKDFKYEAFRKQNPKPDDEPISSKWAKDPEHKMLNIDLALSQQKANKNTDDLFFVALQGLTVAEGATADNEKDKRQAHRQLHQNNVDHEVTREQYYAERAGLKNRREIWEKEALRKTDLWPGDSIRGLIFFETDPHAALYNIIANIEGLHFDTWFWQFKYYPNQSAD